MNLTEGQLLFRLQDFHGAEQEALGIGDYEFAQESADIACALRELLQARRTIEELTAVVGQRNGECVRLHSLLEAAEKHNAELNQRNTELTAKIEPMDRCIAELEARTVTLPQRLQPGADGYDDWYVHSADDGEYLKADDVIAALRAAGIGVKGD
ncbi:hypothetical protein [Citrobacter freundii]|uniref:hypothetical protein n=1 Tax=Citrobacter freundii TaxID=546 RepID=UPI0023509BC5|nr:hypothetical protein [Citrobacter freundii]